jgi:hypothetical protein
VKFRKELVETLRSVPGIWQVFTVFVTMQFITLPFSKSIGESISKVMIQQIDWTSMFLIGAWICRKPGRTQRYTTFIAIMVVPLFFLAYEEAHHHKILWASHVPSFLKVSDPVAAMILAGQVRGATGLYRVKTTFSTPLGIGEFMALAAPFALHWIVTGRSLYTRVGAAMIFVMAWACVRFADARLGVVGFLVTILLYGMYWGLLRFRRDRRDLVGATIVYAYPAVFAVAAVAVQAIHSLHTLVFGGGEAQASNEARQNQLRMGIPKVLQNPIGHGASQSGQSMGYGAGEFVTVDNYWLTIALDYGIIGILTFVLIFLVTVGAGSRAALQSAVVKDRELKLLVPLIIALSSFLIMKLVFSQPENHPLVFAMAGMTVGLTFRARAAIKAAAALETGATEAAAAPPLSRRPLPRRAPAPAAR